MKKLGILLLVLVLGTTISLAQNRDGQRNFDPVESAKKQTEQLKELLGLKKDQEKKVYEVNLKASKQMAEMRKSMQASGNREGMREKIGEMREESNKEMKKILTEDQYKKYEKYLEERRSRRGQGGGGGGNR
jgi:periplasmic protein CpxP/Spy